MVKHYTIYFKIDSEELKIHIVIPRETTEKFEIQPTSQYREWKLNTKIIQFERMQKSQNILNEVSDTSEYILCDPTYVKSKDSHTNLSW